jgi:hypothetical protein
MSTIERQIDALGGTHSNPDYERGHAEALIAASDIAELADAQIDELLELLTDFINGDFVDLAKFSAHVRTTVDGIKRERAGL